ncbi:hypothetical protein NQZ68_008617, partial [Dissostichus eleginoides]
SSRPCSHENIEHSLLQQTEEKLLYCVYTERQLQLRSRSSTDGKTGKIMNPDRL